MNTDPVDEAAGPSAGSAQVDAYIAGFDEEVQTRLQQVRSTMIEAAPGAVEDISYGIPALRLTPTTKAFVFFAGYRHHLSVYPAPRDEPGFATELAEYEGGKGTIQLPLDRPLPVDLIARITRFRWDEARTQAENRT